MIGLKAMNATMAAVLAMISTTFAMRLSGLSI